MKDQLEKRLNELQTEYESGQKMLANLDQQRASMQNTLLRISGAIQVLQEELGKGDPGRAVSTNPNGSKGQLETFLTG